MGLLDQAIADLKKFTTSTTGWAVSINLIALNSETCDVNGIADKHSQTVNPDTGQIVKGKNASCAISESAIIEANPDYPVRNTNGEVAMIGHKVNVKDSTGVTKNYVVLQNWPDEMLGLITLILGDYRTS